VADRTGVKLMSYPKKAAMRRALQEALKTEVSAIGDRHIAIRNNLTSNWTSKNRPKFTKVGPKNSSDGIEMQIKMRAQEANQASISAYTLLDQGTSERKVRLVNWQSKTQPRSLISGPGSGYVVRRADGSPVIFPPVPGITKREFDDTANETLQPEMKEATDKAIRAALSKVVK